MTTPSDVLRLITEIGDRQPTRKEWAVLRSMSNKAITHTIAEYIKTGHRPPVLNKFDAENSFPGLHKNH